jgi:hypothetical protein
MEELLEKLYIEIEELKMYKEVHNKPHVHIDIGKKNHIASIEIEI